MLGALIGIAPFAVKLAEVIFHKLKPGAKTGSDKLDFATQVLRLLTAKLEASGGPQPTDDALKAIVETSLATLKGTGALEAALDEPALLPIPRPAAVPAEQQIWVIVGGQMVTVSKPS